MIGRLVGMALLAGSAVALAPTATSDPAAFSAGDETFYRLLTEGDEEDPGLTITNFPLIRAQGLLACQRQDDGMDGLDAVHLLQAEGPYSFDVANSIVSAAVVTYCRQHLGI
ncbi:DUF732 domain-containing protein [Mycolicibacterium porcinum]|uniref:DUF732 domain-containing protein n=1 Tax=Mycolicibacterium porcinum TaxID=39693 RepID=UPI0031F8C943